MLAETQKSYVRDQQRSKALSSNLNDSLNLTFSLISNFFQPLQIPKPGQWLDAHPSQGQTYKAYSQGSHHKVAQKRKTICILPLNQEIEQKFLIRLQTYCECFYHPLPVRVLASSKSILKNATSRINDGVKQYHAGKILQQLKNQLKNDMFCLIGITISDLYPRQSWSWVFGLASLEGRTGVFSFARHDSRFYDNKKYEIDYDRILWSSIGTLVHEVGHMFGLKHCVYYRCIMNGSNSSQQASTKPLQPCPICLKKLQSNIKFNIQERYKKISSFLQQKSIQKSQSIKVKGLVKMISNVLSELSKQKQKINEIKVIQKPSKKLQQQKSKNVVRSKTLNKKLLATQTPIKRGFSINKQNLNLNMNQYKNQAKK